MEGTIVAHHLRSIVERTPSRLVDKLAKQDGIRECDGMVDYVRI